MVHDLEMKIKCLNSGALVDKSVSTELAALVVHIDRQTDEESEYLRMCPEYSDEYHSNLLTNQPTNKQLTNQLTNKLII